VKPGAHRLRIAAALASVLAPWLLAAAPSPARAQGVADAAALRLHSLAATCAQCHGTDGRPAAGASVPALAGVPAARIVEQMDAFKRGTRSGTVMPQLAKGYSDEQIAQLAAYFAAAGAKR
jgi:cytochrome subunit of sulfide dehydrogenase